MAATYLPPLDRLLTLGAEPARRRTWPDYRLLGLEPRHVPSLIAMATDPALLGAPERDRAVWAPLHAWRALGQLRAEAAVQPLLDLLQQNLGDESIFDELPLVLGMIGPAALHAATVLLFDESRDEDLRIAAAAIIANVGLEEPGRADEAAAVLVKQLEDWRVQSPQVNAVLIMELVSLGETAAAPLMETVFDAGAVDESITGDWNDTQVDLGLVPAPEQPPAFGAPARRDGSARPPKDADARARARRKAEKQARKRNRKKK